MKRALELCSEMLSLAKGSHPGKPSLKPKDKGLATGHQRGSIHSERITQETGREDVRRVRAPWWEETTLEQGVAEGKY